MRVLSLFDGMACGMLAMLEAGIDVERYVAFEIDKYAIRSATHNFPMIDERGDVFEADFTEFRGFDFLVGGSPCTYWSIAKTSGRETEASGIGWELFSQYVRALREAQPRWFVYENNKSMSNAIRESITKAFGFEPICINSALVSAQNRQRLYWVGKREVDGTYSKVDIQQPADRGILLRDVLDGVTDREKCRRVTASVGRTTTREYFQKNQNTMAYEPVPFGETADGKSFCLTARYYKGVGTAPNKVLEKSRDTMVAEPVRLPEYGKEDKARPLGANYPNNCGGFEHRMFSNNPNKQQVDMIAEPVNTTTDGKARTLIAGYHKQGIENCCGFAGFGSSGVAEPVCMRYQRSEEAKAVRKQYEAGEVQHGFHELSELHPRPDGKTNTLSTVLKDNPICEPVPAYATPCEWDENGKPVKAISAADGKTYTVYEVKDGFITIKGKRYAIKLADGFYIIRKLTVSECKRLQTVPEYYEFPVSDSRAFQQLGNGWTILIISHLIKACLAPTQIKDATFCNKDGEYQWF